MQKLKILCVLSVSSVVSCGKSLVDQVPYPENYRSFFHVKSMELKKDHPLYKDFGGLHHVYVNHEGLEALKKGGPFPDGSILVFDLFEVTSDNQITSEKERKVLAVMYKNTKAFAKTGGWGFEAFRGDSRERLVNGNHEACFGCHAQQKAKDYVFSEFRP
ncbi:MAG: cytochrome P460 family protein [Leptospiraceae bacterium]|nr:cytochrome P460 family protein [Leptospiraceae bacterium]MDW8306912.1 cytochrome P460 family protein [Leptospiraceae bacterium]